MTPNVRQAGPLVLAAAGAIAYLLLEPPSADLAAQEYRVALFDEVGFTLWNNGWYAGHHVPAYSVVSAPLGALLGARPVGALAAVAAAALFAAIARGHWVQRGAEAAALWFAAATAATLLTGRITFVLGVAIGLAAVLALQHRHGAVAAALAAATALASPVAALFVALAALAHGLSAPSERGIAGAGVAVAALAPLLVLALLFPEGGSEPFVASAFWPALAATALVAAVLPARERSIRIGAGLYAALLVAAFAFSNPLGGNATRLGALFAGPIALGALVSRRPSPALLAALAPALAYWALYPPIRDVVRASGDPSTEPTYYAGLVRFLERREPRTRGFRVEIPFTENHWEARHVAPHVALARGWERQLDRRYGALFYDGTLDPTTYRAWLEEHAVAYVALPDVPLDYAARDEARLIERGAPYLRPVWRDAHWRVFAVRRPRPLVRGAARSIALQPDGFVLSARRTGVALVRIRHTRWWRVAAGRACIERGPDAMTRVRIHAPGTIRVRASLRGSACRR